MITMQELNPHGYEPSPEVLANLKDLLAKLNAVRTLYGKPMVINSGLRSQEDQERINPKAPKSKHLMGQAADIRDVDGKFTDWIKANMSTMENIGFWFEDFAHTIGWCHMQSTPPGSGRRVFIP